MDEKDQAQREAVERGTKEEGRCPLPVAPASFALYPVPAIFRSNTMRTAFVQSRLGAALDYCERRMLELR
jgi:hypothetical protein